MSPAKEALAGTGLHGRRKTRRTSQKPASRAEPRINRKRSHRCPLLPSQVLRSLPEIAISIKHPSRTPALSLSVPSILSRPHQNWDINKGDVLYSVCRQERWGGSLSFFLSFFRPSSPILLHGDACTHLSRRARLAPARATWNDRKGSAHALLSRRNPLLWLPSVGPSRAYKKSYPIHTSAR